MDALGPTRIFANGSSPRTVIKMPVCEAALVGDGSWADTSVGKDAENVQMAMSKTREGRII
jgi:hypothetical protein